MLIVLVVPHLLRDFVAHLRDLGLCMLILIHLNFPNLYK